MLRRLNIFFFFQSVGLKHPSLQSMVAGLFGEHNDALKGLWEVVWTANSQSQACVPVVPFNTLCDRFQCIGPYQYIECWECCCSYYSYYYYYVRFLPHPRVSAILYCLCDWEQILPYGYVTCYYLYMWMYVCMYVCVILVLFWCYFMLF